MLDGSKLDAAMRANDFPLWLALKHHKTHKKEFLNFETHPFLKYLYVTKSDYIVVIKSTQCGVTEYLIVRALSAAIDGRSVFYVLPTYGLVGRFVRNRIEKSISNTEYYKSLSKVTRQLTDRKLSESTTLKDIGKGTIAFVGSHTSSGFAEYPADDLIIDELDECNQKNLEMAWERLSASKHKRQMKVANPTFEGFGIDKEFADTNQMLWNIKCDCGVYTTYDWFRHVVRQTDDDKYVIRDKEWTWNSKRDIYPICDKCGRPMNRHSDGIWVPTYDRIKEGLRISKLFSGTVTYLEMMERFIKGQKDDRVLQRFYNADLGEAYTAAGAKINTSMLNDCLGDYRNEYVRSDGYAIMGIDVGSVLHVMIGYINPDRTVQVAHVSECPVDVNEVLRLKKKYNVVMGVIDALPEKHFVSKLKTKFKNLFSCYYAEAKTEPVDSYRNVTVDRTGSLDSVKEALVMNEVTLPGNSESIHTFYDHMTASIRVFDQERNHGNGAYIWDNCGKADHFHHAMNYMYVARKMIIAMK